MALIRRSAAAVPCDRVGPAAVPGLVAPLRQPPPARDRQLQTQIGRQLFVVVVAGQQRLGDAARHLQDAAHATVDR